MRRIDCAGVRLVQYLHCSDPELTSSQMSDRRLLNECVTDRDDNGPVFWQNQSWVRSYATAAVSHQALLSTPILKVSDCFKRAH